MYKHLVLWKLKKKLDSLPATINEIFDYEA